MAGALDGRDGDDVRADLRAVIERAKDARTVLGLAPTAGPIAARAAFHTLCKKYHPARFARSSPETVRLANEAFLAIKRAYDGLIRPPEPPKPAVEPAPPKPSKANGPTATMSATAKATVPMAPIAAPRPPAEKAAAHLRPPAAAAPAAAPAAAEKPSQTRPTEKLPPQPRTASPEKPSQTRPTERMPAQVRAAILGGAQARATERLQAAARPRTSAVPVQPKADPALAAPVAPEPSEEHRFAAALDLLRRRLWRDAEKALGELAVTVPTERKYRAFRHYARGRMAQDEGRLDEARGEWERALRLDPEHAPSRAAIEQLPEPPKPPSGGLLSKLFKRS